MSPPFPRDARPSETFLGAVAVYVDLDGTYRYDTAVVAFDAAVPLGPIYFENLRLALRPLVEGQGERIA